jgi:hypothetical protein
LPVLAVLALTGAALCIFPFKGNTASGSPALEILDAVSGRVYGLWSMEEGGEFAVEFVHSVNQSPVRETFRVEGGEIRPSAVRFYSFGAGMPAELEEGQVMSRDGDALVISGFNRTFTELNYIVGTVSDHLLLVNGQTVSLRDLCGKNAHIKIRYRRN